MGEGGEYRLGFGISNQDDLNLFLKKNRTFKPLFSFTDQSGGFTRRISEDSS